LGFAKLKVLAKLKLQSCSLGKKLNIQWP